WAGRCSSSSWCSSCRSRPWRGSSGTPSARCQSPRTSRATTAAPSARRTSPRPARRGRAAARTAIPPRRRPPGCASGSRRAPAPRPA
ncbi:MAG: hypothetical protein AVDCRST_MAG64-1374, partial [uncultured Phycisphaerae bacterium]